MTGINLIASIDGKAIPVDYSSLIGKWETIEPMIRVFGWRSSFDDSNDNIEYL